MIDRLWKAHQHAHCCIDINNNDTSNNMMCGVDRTSNTALALSAQVEQQAVQASPRAVASVVDAIRASASKELRLTVQRGSERLTIPVVPAPAPDGAGRIGVQLAANVDIERVRASGPGEAASFASRDFGRLLGAVTGGALDTAPSFVLVVVFMSGGFC